MTNNKAANFPDIFYIYLSILAGLLAAQKISFPAAGWLSFTCLFLIISIFLLKKSFLYVLEQPSKKYARIMILLTVFCAAATRTAFQYQVNKPLQNTAANSPEIVTITGIIDRPPEVRTNRTYLQITPENDPENAEISIPGKIQVVCYWADESYDYGDRIMITGKLSVLENSGETSYYNYLELQGIRAIMYSPKIDKISQNHGNLIYAGIYRIREILLEKIYRLYPSPENALMAGILLGDESKIPADVEDDFQRTGTAHIIAISGANFSVLVWLLLKLIRAGIHRWWAPLILIPIIYFYAILAGGKSAIIRAAIMCSLTLVGMVIGRGKTGVYALLFSASLIGIYDPKTLFNISLQLSITATLGILLFKDPLRSAIDHSLARFRKMSEGTRSILVNFLDEFLLISISAQIFTIWISAAAFHQFSLISLLANFLITPFQSVIMLGGVLSLLAGLIFEPFGSVIAALVWVAPAYTIRAVHFCSEFSWASGYFLISGKTAWYIILTILLIWIFRKRFFQFKKEALAEKGLVILFFLTIMIWRTVLDLNEKRLRIEFSGTSTSQQIHIRTPEHQKIIIALDCTNYSARDLISDNFIDTGLTKAAFIDFSELWMKEAFLESDVELPEYIYLNGINPKPGPDVIMNDLTKLNPGFHMQTGNVAVDIPITYLRRRGWQITYDELSVFIPMGISLDYIDKQDREDLIGNSNLILLGNDDDSAEWKKHIDERYCTHGSCSISPLILDTGKKEELEIYSDGQKIWLFGSG
ncbi:MAG: ComEC/Rec2 family competence protein [Flexilinea sp.]